MTKRTLLTVIATLLLTFNISNIAFAEPNSSETQTIQESKAQYEQLDNETLKLNSEITKLNNEIETINIELLKNNSEIKDTEIEIENINKKINDSKIEIEEQEKKMDKRLRSMYKTDISSSMIAYIITSENIFDLFYRVQAMSKLISVDKEIISEINEKKEQLAEDAKAIEEKQEDLKKLRIAIENDLNEVAKKKEEQEVALSNLNARKEEIMDVIEANEVNLISHSLSIINSSSSISDIENAVNNLNSLLPQLNSDYAINLTEEAIASGNNQISEYEASILEENSSSNLATESVNGSVTNNLGTYTMSATAYTGGGLTAMGIKPVRDPNGLSTVSVDPNVIPLGSKVYIDGYGYAIASDTGGAIKGNKIDLYMNSLQDCYSFGRQSVTVTIVAYPNQW
ncbi:3D domain-containing protein [Clostridium gallinarum]|nr:3D domain-containing protein [Clostridium gallinarum]